MGASTAESGAFGERNMSGGASTTLERSFAERSSHRPVVAVLFDALRHDWLSPERTPELWSLANLACGASYANRSPLQ